MATERTTEVEIGTEGMHGLGPFTASTLPEFMDAFRGVDLGKCGAVPQRMVWPLNGCQIGDASVVFTPDQARQAEQIAGATGLEWYDADADSIRPLSEMAAIARPRPGFLRRVPVGIDHFLTFRSPAVPVLAYRLYVTCNGATGRIDMAAYFERSPGAVASDLPELQDALMSTHTRPT